MSTNDDTTQSTPENEAQPAGDHFCHPTGAPMMSCVTEDPDHPFPSHHPFQKDLFFHRSIQSAQTASFSYGDWKLTVQDKYNGGNDHLIHELGLNATIIANYSDGGGVAAL